MNLIVITAVIAVCGAAKLDRTYLPPPSAKTAGGSPGSLQTPFAGNSFNEGLGGLPKGSYTNDFQGVVVDAATAGTRASGPEDTGLGAPRISYGSTASKVGEAAFKGSVAGFRQFPDGSQGQNVARDGQIAGTHISSQGLGHGFSSQGVQVSTRPQAASERSSNTLKFESDVGPESFNYAFETENGILAEENGIEANGVQAKGGFSYVGDNGQVYSVAYTADEGGYQPKGDHLPTPPPIPPEILKSLEQNAREEAAGIVDDGSYDAQKYNEGGDYTESDSNNGQYNNRQSNRSGNRAESDATASGTLISQNNQPFGSPNRLPGHTSSVDKSTNGFGSLNGNLGQSSLSGAFGSKNEYLPPRGQSRRPTQGLKPGAATSPDSSSQFDQASNLLTSNFQPLNNQFNGRPQNSHISATSTAFASGSQPSTASQLGQQKSEGFQQKQPSIGVSNHFTQNVHSNLPSPAPGFTQFSSATSQEGAHSNQPQSQSTAFGSLNSQRATSPPQIVLTTPHESSPSSSQQSSDAASSPSQTSSSAFSSFNSQSSIGHPTQPHIGIQSNSGLQQNIHGGEHITGSTQRPALSVPTQASNFGSQNLNTRPLELQNQQQSLSIQGQEPRPSSSFGSFNAQSLSSSLQGSSSRPLNVPNHKQSFGIQGQGSPSSTPGSFGSQSLTSGLQGSSSGPNGAQSVDQTTNKQGQGSTTAFGSSSRQPTVSGLPSFPSQPFGAKNQGQSTQDQGSTSSASASVSPQSLISRPVGSGFRPFGSQNGDQTLNLHSQSLSQSPASSSAFSSLNSQSPTISAQSDNSQSSGITSGLQTQTSAISSLGPQIQGQVSQFGNKQLQSSTSQPSQDSEGAQKLIFSQAQGPDHSYYYNQPSRPFSTSNAQIQNSRFPSTSSNQFNRVTQQPSFSSQSSAQISNTQQGIPSTSFPQSGLQGFTRNPLGSVAPTSPTQGKPGQFQASTFPSAFNGITQASASSFVAASPTTSTQFSGQQSGQFGSRPSFQQSSIQFNNNLGQPQPSVSSFGQKTTATSQKPGQFSQKPGSLQGQTQTFGQRPIINQGQPGSALDGSGSSPSVPTQQYEGEIYEYKKPPQSLPVPSQKETSSSTPFGQKDQATQSSAQSSSRPQFGQSQGGPDAQSSSSTQSGSQQPSQGSLGIQSPRPQFVQGIQPAQATQFGILTSQGQAQQSSTRPQVGAQPFASFGVTHSTQSAQFNAQELRPQEPHTAQDYRLQSGAGSSKPFGGIQSTQSTQINAQGSSSQQSQNPKDTTVQFNAQGSGKPTTSCCQGITSGAQSGQDAAKPTQGFQFGSTSASRPNFGAQTQGFGTQTQGFGVRQPSQGVSAHSESQFSSPGSSFPGSQNIKPNQLTSQSVAGKGEVFGGQRKPPSFDEQSGYIY